jgi:RimJ/RimL family protein N-acetyltransferase
MTAATAASCLVGKLHDARQLFERLLGVEPGNRPIAHRPDLVDRRVHHRVDALEPPGHRRQAIGERRELAGDQGEQAPAEQVHPVQRIPRLLAQVKIGEAHRFELLDQQVAVDGIVGRQALEPAELGQPPIGERDPRLPTGSRHVRPAIVVGVLTDAGRGGREEPEELGQERVGTRAEVGHGNLIGRAAERGASLAAPLPSEAMSREPWIQPVVLEGRIVRLEPLRRDHLDGLAEVAFDPTLWQFTLARPVDRGGLEAWLETALANAQAGTEMPFATVDQASGRPIGSTRYLAIVPEHRRFEIGWTWLATTAQRTGANREAKLLQLTHGFEQLAANRIEFKTDSLNERSRAALLGIGAQFEGVFRNHMVMPDGRLRHSAYYSVTREDWPSVRARLNELLRRGTASG